MRGLLLVEEGRTNAIIGDEQICRVMLESMRGAAIGIGINEWIHTGTRRTFEMKEHSARETSETSEFNPESSTRIFFLLGRVSWFPPLTDSFLHFISTVGTLHSSSY